MLVEDQVFGFWGQFSVGDGSLQCFGIPVSEAILASKCRKTSGLRDFRIVGLGFSS